MMQSLKCVNKSKNSKHKSIKKMIKRLQVYVYMLSRQDLIRRLFLNGIKLFSRYLVSFIIVSKVLLHSPVMKSTIETMFTSSIASW